MEQGSEHSEDSDYEPAPIACTMNDSQPPPLPPPRSSFMFPHASFTFPRRVHSHGSVDLQSSIKPRNQLSLCQAMRKSISTDLKFLLPKEPVQLSQFITRYSALLPCQVQVRNGLGSTSLASAPLQSNILQLHFIKHSKVVVMKEKESGEECSVPLNSAAKFGLVYNPNADLLEAMAGFEFRTAGDVMAMKPLPLLMKATQSYKGSSAESSVEEEEIFWVLGIKNSFRSKQLRVRSLEKGNKLLSEKCLGAFTTLPDDIQLPLVTLLDLGLRLPQSAVAFGNDSTAQSTKYPVMLEKMAGETCIIASYPDPEEGKELSHLEVSSDLEVEVETVAMDPSSRKNLEVHTQDLFVKFNESKPSLIVQKSSKQVYDLQILLHSQLLPGREQEGVQLVHPPMLGIDQQPCEDPPRSEASSSHPPTPEVNILSPTPSSEVPPKLENDYQVVPTDEGTADEDYVYMARLGSIPESLSEDAFNPRSRSQSVETESPKRISRVVPNDEPQSQSVHASNNLSSKLDNLLQQVGLLSTCMKQQDCVLKEMKKLQSTMLAVRKDVELLKCSISTKEAAKTSPDPQEEEYERNRRFLATLDTHQILKVLDALDLPEYKEAFQKEHINGHVLLQLNHQVLEDELGMNSKLHRIRLMTVVSGKVSSNTLLP